MGTNPPLPPGWKTAIHGTTNRQYYYHRERGETMWNLEDVLESERAALGVMPNSPQASGNSDTERWVGVMDVG
ncbi:hypothetical protein KIPB_004489 [Kipferlia bialata]|uniref:WW domain-containing protein n=1 Tax=Kipferlia bialata TaxID=797122 RepID=A0A9K3CVI0_9EUKA|nr:hypothetical protein KIPB_004489 [Kipferlia bialata]|eukprot:g4489.t1